MPPVLTVQQILTILHEQVPNGTWSEIDGLTGLPVVTVNGPSAVNFSLSSGVIVKSFVNSETAEIRTFLAKSIEGPGRENL